MKKILISFLSGVIAGFAAVMLFMHKDLVKAAIKGEKLPEAPEGCPACKK